tara:strand:+ start:394 stop:735 length:342 start_codon:yes stop_codon:yes gene_type:complete
LNPIEEAKDYYKSKGWSFEQDLGFYLCHGYVFCTPDRVLLFKPIRKDIGESDWHPDEPDCWYVHFAVGKDALSWFMDKSPHYLPFIAWARDKGSNGKLRVYETNRLHAKLSLK